MSMFLIIMLLILTSVVIFGCIQVIKLCWNFWDVYLPIPITIIVLIVILDLLVISKL